MHDAVAAAVEWRRAAIAGGRQYMGDVSKLGPVKLRFDDRNIPRLFQRERWLLDRSWEKADRHRAELKFSALDRRKRCLRTAMRAVLFQRAMVGRFLRLVHCLTISDAGCPRSVKADEDRHEQSQEPGFQHMLA